jgi:sugar phosphate isomerase/epimerase
VTQQASSTLPRLTDFTFSFNCIGEVSLAERFAATRDAGFVQVGLSCRWMKLWLEEHSFDELDALLDEYGLVVGELEAIRVMQVDIDPLEDVAALLAERYRPIRLQAIGPYEGTIEEAAARAARVADRFAAWGVEVVLEPLPFTNMKTPADAADICRIANRPNLSICMDVWHLYRNRLPLSHLDNCWEYISSLQLNDGTVESEYPDDLREDCLRNRRIPGQGEFDLVGLLSAAVRNRSELTYSIEVIETSLRAQDAGLTARQIAAGITDVLTELERQENAS